MFVNSKSQTDSYSLSSNKILLGLLTKSYSMSGFHKVPKINLAHDKEMTETSTCTDDDHEADDVSPLQTDLGPQPLTVMKAR